MELVGNEGGNQSPLRYTNGQEERRVIKETVKRGSCAKGVLRRSCETYGNTYRTKPKV